MMLLNNLFSPPCIVIGMHRSGTSLLSSLLHDGGIFMGCDWDHHQESMYFQRMNEMLMASMGSDWDSPIPTPPDAVPAATSFGIVRRYLKPHKHPAQFAKLLCGKPWGWKDPRNTFTLPAWLKVFPDAKVIHIFRNGMDVALSLYHRNIQNGRTNRFYSSKLESKAEGFQLWERYVAQAFSYMPMLGDRMLTLQFEKLIACDADEVTKLESFTGRPLRSILTALADQSRQQRFQQGRDDDLIKHARQNSWMQKLGYGDCDLVCGAFGA